MKSALSLLVAKTLIVLCAFAQPKAEQAVKAVNDSIDLAVVNKDLEKLERFYADDFVFTHGTGKVEGKKSWIADVAAPNKRFVSREHDSTHVELHDDIAILKGRLLIKRMNKNDEARYGIWYIRIFRRSQKGWRLISHTTTKEWHF